MLEEYAVGFAATYSPIFQFADFNGSDNTILNHDVSIYADWTVFDHPIFGKGRIDLYAYHQADELLGKSAADAAANLGSSWLLSDADADGTYTSLSALWWEQILFDGHLDFTFGQLDPTLLFDTNRYAGWDRWSFMATPVSSNPTRIFQSAGLGLYLEVLDWDIGYVILTVMDADADGRYPDFKSLGNDRWAYFLEAGLLPIIPSLGKLEISVTLNAVDKTDDGPASEAVLVSLSQDIGDRFGFFLRYGHNDGKLNDIEEMLSTGIVFKGIFDFTSDWVGVAFMWAQPVDSTLRDQLGVEAYWRLQITERVQFTPDLQIILNPTFRPNADLEVVGGLRLLFSF
jgi:porin